MTMKLKDDSCSGCFVVIGIILVIYFIVEVVIPFIVNVIVPIMSAIVVFVAYAAGIVLAVAAAIGCICIVVGVIYGIGTSCHNFIRACGAHLLGRTDINTVESARESYFYWKGDWWFNLGDTYKVTWDFNADETRAFWRRAKAHSQMEWHLFQCLFWGAASGFVWIGTVLFLPILFVAFGLLFSLVFVTYNILALSIYGVELIRLKLHGVSYRCPEVTCLNRTLPSFECSNPSCLVRHRLIPTARYGIFFRTCKCGAKLPTTRRSRNKLKAYCSREECGIELWGGNYRPMTIAFLGGPSVGKSMVHLAMCCGAKQIFQKHNWEYSENPADAKMINDMKNRMNRGIRPDSTQVGGFVRAFCINLQKPENAFPLRLYFYDPPGETFTGANKMTYKRAEYNYYKDLRAVVIVIDPFSIPQIVREFANELKDEARRKDIKPALISPEESFERWLGSMKNDHGGVDKKKTLCAVLINKTDAPGFAEKTGLVAGNASDAECRNFLKDYDLEHFMGQIDENFSECRCFAISTTGGSLPGTPLQPKGIEQVMDWLLTHNFFQ